MAFFRQYVLPFLVILIFAVALLAVSARIFLPADMVAPAPVGTTEAVEPQAQIAIPGAVISETAIPETAIPETVAGLPPSLKVLIQGLPATAPL